MDKGENLNTKERIEVLLVEDDEVFAEGLKDALEDENFDVTIVSNGNVAYELIKNKVFPIIISDINLPGKSGEEILELSKKRAKFTKVILITGYGSIESAVRAMKKGADDYITKPFDMEEFILRVKKLAEFYRKERELERITFLYRDENVFMGIVGKSKKMKIIFEMIKAAAETDAPVLITGESGTGKELVANAIQVLSPRKDKPYIKINCAAIPESLLESELFGYEKGAFTGANRRYEGKIIAADKGTLFLDEIGEMNYNLQSKLLRVIEEKKLMPIGSTKEKDFDVRIISATQKDLEEAIRKKEFRKDLYFRLKVIHIHLPPLKERKEDIPLLINYFIRKFSLKYNKNFKISDKLIKNLIKRDYPGNVRELENLIHSLIILNKNKELIEDNVDTVNFNEQEKLFGIFDLTKPYSEIINQFEKIYLQAILKKFDYKKGLVANIMQISRKNLWEKLKKHNIS